MLQDVTPMGRLKWNMNRNPFLGVWGFRVYGLGLYTLSPKPMDRRSHPETNSTASFWEFRSTVGFKP